MQRWEQPADHTMRLRPHYPRPRTEATFFPALFQVVLQLASKWKPSCSRARVEALVCAIHLLTDAGEIDEWFREVKT